MSTSFDALPFLLNFLGLETSTAVLYHHEGVTVFAPGLVLPRLCEAFVAQHFLSHSMNSFPPLQAEMRVTGCDTKVEYKINLTIQSFVTLTSDHKGQGGLSCPLLAKRDKQS